METDISRKQVQKNIFLLLLATLVAASVTSKFLMSAAMILLLANWLVEGNFREKFSTARRNGTVIAFSVLYAVHVVWCLVSSNWNYATDDLVKKLPLLLIPVITITSNHLNRKNLQYLLIVYCLTVFAASTYGIIHYYSIPSLEYRKIFPHFSNIRFALNVCLAMFTVLYGIKEIFNSKTLKNKTLYTTIHIIAEAVFAVILLLLQSYTAFVILAITGTIILLRYGFQKKKKSIYLTIFIGIFLALLTGIWLVNSSFHDYYDLKVLSARPQAKFTPSGNEYTHANDGLIEMGNYVNNYVCARELETEWAKRSTIPVYAKTADSFAVFPALIRYLNAKNLTKDSAGMAELDQSDILQIEKGIANPYYAEKYSIKKMLYRMFFEYELYRSFGEIRYSSMLQRFELWKNGTEIFCNNPVLGVGTGDVNDEIRANLRRNGSQLADTTLRTHNQYITILLSFGILGFGIIAFFFARAVKRKHLLKSGLFVCFLCIVLISFISEDTLETEAGCVFTALWASLFNRRDE